MTPVPSGTLHCLEDGRRQLVMTRTFPAPIEDVWASLTESERTARWFGPWRGVGKRGETISVTWMAEEGQPEGEMTIAECDRPRYLALISGNEEEGIWEIEVELVEADGRTTLNFRQTLGPDMPAVMVGAGWEYYLDRFVAARDSAEMPAWESYHPGQNGYYEELDEQLSCG